MITKTLSGGWSVLTETETALLHQFVTRVNNRANMDVLRGGEKHSAHSRAMTLELLEIERVKHGSR